MEVVSEFNTHTHTHTAGGGGGDGGLWHVSVISEPHYTGFLLHNDVALATPPTATSLTLTTPWLFTGGICQVLLVRLIEGGVLMVTLATRSRATDSSRTMPGNKLYHSVLE